MNLTYGSLFSGIGGLDLAVEEVFGATAAWHCEVDPNASKVLAARWPGVPNLGDIQNVEWAEVPPVDIICGGFPCQDISSAGKRAGIVEGSRSGLWFRYADAIRVLRPRLVVVENVGALLVRGLDIVLGSLAEIGYDARWTCLRASDIGAPHQRNRLFLVGVPRDTEREGGEGGQLCPGSLWRHQGPAGEPSGDHPNPTGSGWEPRRATGQAIPEPGAVQRPGRLRGRAGEEPSPDPAQPERRTEEQQDLGAPAGPAAEPGERPRPAPDPDGRRLQERPELHGATEQDSTNGHPRREHTDGHMGATDWGRYAPAIRRWESLTRPAPSPVDERGRLSPRFTEWMMGYADGWVSDLLPHGPALKACGNGVVTAQAVEAILRLMSIDITESPDREVITIKKETP